jgi:hypothetical protein
VTDSISTAPPEVDATPKTAGQIRSDLLDFLERDLVGPSDAREEVIGDQPRIRYVAGVLFPQGSAHDESAAAGGVEAVGGGAEGPDAPVLDPEEDSPETAAGKSRAEPEAEGTDETVTLANQYRPSAMAVSFMVAVNAGPLAVQPRAAIYTSETMQEEKSDYERRQWRRRSLPIEEVKIDPATIAGRGRPDHELADGLALRAVARRKPDGRHLVTISLFNTTRESAAGITFFQVGIRVRGYDGTRPFVEYRSLEEAPVDAEELALQMAYRKRTIFAVGHGCATDWSDVEGERAGVVESATLPKVTVPPVEPHAADWPGLSMQFLSGVCAEPEREIPEALEAICREYETWIAEQRKLSEGIAPRYRSPAAKHIARCEIALQRMRVGTRAIARDSTTRRAFMLANRAMLMQQHHSRLRRSLDDAWVELPDRDQDSGYASRWTEGERIGYWRTFQLAFFLMILPGLESDEAEVEVDSATLSSRDLVDLIWFPTGGGKTEAYLGAAAFSIFLGRLREPESHGCKVLMRYTLRLLTSQQFQRAASLVSACELIRRDEPKVFGDARISIGLWVGKSLTPNEEEDARSKLSALSQRREGAKNPFQLLSCPWCGTVLDDPQKLGYSERAGRMIFLCPAASCPFSDRRDPLPVCVVDESIYADPPTLLIGTVDKFAMLAWRDRASSILTEDGGPELIIQDELHLISGPLGSMVGLYEGAIEYLCSLGGGRPKIVASTATIRRAEEQCWSLYGRHTFQFPPSGLDASDSFFAKEVPNAPGRVFVGCLPSAASSPLTAQIRSVVALQQGLKIVGGGAPDDALDPYWTLVQYYGSLKELGRAATFVTADIPEFLPTMHRRYELDDHAKRWMRTSEELTSRKNEEEIPKILKRLETRYQSDASFGDQALDTVLATNMISVGVDVDRLGLMMIVTQPKGTSEYIQASSRVGRSSKGPGLVFTLYNASRPRDRSHYEHFKGYHQSYYRFVEPTSVTPFSPPALERGLHAIIAIGARHVAGWSSPSEPALADRTFLAFLEAVRERVRKIDPNHLADFESVLERRLEDWRCGRPEIWGSLAKAEDRAALMKPAGMVTTELGEGIWDTPTSMRNVDVECEARVIPRY